MFSGMAGSPSKALSFPEAWEEDWTSRPFGHDYGRHLLGWLQRLRWHDQPAAPVDTWEVPYTVMMLSFSDYAAVPPLVKNVLQPGSYWLWPQATSQLQHVSLRQLVTRLRAALLGELLNHAIFPCAEVKDVAYLRYILLQAHCANRRLGCSTLSPRIEVLRALANTPSSTLPTFGGHDQGCTKECDTSHSRPLACRGLCLS